MNKNTLLVLLLSGLGVNLYGSNQATSPDPHAIATQAIYNNRQIAQTNTRQARLTIEANQRPLPVDTKLNERLFLANASQCRFLPYNFISPNCRDGCGRNAAELAVKAYFQKSTDRNIFTFFKGLNKAGFNFFGRPCSWLTVAMKDFGAPTSDTTPLLYVQENIIRGTVDKIVQTKEIDQTPQKFKEIINGAISKQRSINNQQRSTNLSKVIEVVSFLLK